MKALDIDWEAVRLLYETTTHTPPDIARRFGIAPGTLHKRIKREGWERTIAKAIEERTRAATKTHGLSETLHRHPEAFVNEKVAARVESAIERAVDINLRIIAEHREHTGAMRQAITVLMQELIHDTENIGDILHQIEIESTATDESQEAETDIDWAKRQRMLNAVSLNQRANTAQKLAQALKTIIEMDRISYGIDENVGKPKNPDTLKTLLEQIDGQTLALPSQLKRISA
jgi:hypothetical protein